MKKESYLGDGVYAEFSGDAIILRTGTNSDDLCQSKIYLEYGVINNLLAFMQFNGMLPVDRSFPND